jgi:hypothetical protein
MARLPQISALAQGGVPREFSAEATEFAGTEEPKSGPIFAPVRSTTTTSNTDDEPKIYRVRVSSKAASLNQPIP